MSDPVHPTPAPPNARRKLIRGVFAAPAVLTVSSGSALAATSASCLQKQLSRSEYPEVSEVPIPTGTTWMRVQLGVMESTTSPSLSVYYVDPRNFPSPPGYLGGSLRLFNIGTNSEGTEPLSEPALQANFSPYSKSGGKWAVIRYNASGTIVGVGKGTVGQDTAVGRSCWTKFISTMQG
jgi:hypothetical protein